jgi:hypothetical protein
MRREHCGNFSVAHIVMSAGRPTGGGLLGASMTAESLDESRATADETIC